MFKHLAHLRLGLRTEVAAVLAAVTAAGFGGQTASAQHSANDVIRLNRSNPVIFRNLFPSNRRNDGNNIAAPSMVRIPGFVSSNRRANSSARYYLYFSDHDGDYIRMGYSSRVDGGFQLYRAGASTGSRGVFDNNNTSITLDEGIQIRRNHIASPDVHIGNNQFIMYFHSGAPYRFNGRDFDRQVSWVNTSSDGLNFRRRDTRSVVLGASYFKVFEDRNRLYAVTNDGGPIRARSNNSPWAPPNGYYNGNSLSDLWQARSSGNEIRSAVSGSRRVRHSGLRRRGSNLELFYTLRGDSPERIYVSNMSLSSSNWNNWNINIPGNELMRAVGGWEEGQRTPSASQGGAATNVNQLRDPDIFEDTDGAIYMYYSGAGEEGIGVAAIESSRHNVRTFGATHDAETRQGGDRNRNFRSSGTITVANGSGTSQRRGFFRFNTPNGPTVRAAVLRLYLQNNESGNLDVYGTGNFNESSINGNNQPNQQGGRIDRVPIGFRGFYELDITPWVNSNRSRNIRVVVRATGSAGVQIASSENGNNSRRPQLKFMQNR